METYITIVRDQQAINLFLARIETPNCTRCKGRETSPGLAEGRGSFRNDMMDSITAVSDKVIQVAMIFCLRY